MRPPEYALIAHVRGTGQSTADTAQISESSTMSNLCPDHSDGRHRYDELGICMGATCTAQVRELKPCRSPYCECERDKCTHPGFRDARHEDDAATEEARLRAIFEATARDSFNFRRSRRGTYINPAIARDWKWFCLGSKKGKA